MNEYRFCGLVFKFDSELPGNQEKKDWLYVLVTYCFITIHLWLKIATI